MARYALGILLICAWPWGCSWPAPRRPDSSGRGGLLEPLPVQQARAYPETVTGDFVSLADFEDTPGGGRGRDQVKHFAIGPDGAEGIRRFVVNVTRTGVGAMQVVLSPKAVLVFETPAIHDFAGYTLLSLALHSESARDDLRVTLTSDTGSWTSNRTPLGGGWNTVLIDVKRLDNLKDFNISAVRTVRIAFGDPAGPVIFNVDDILLIDNERALGPTPPGLALRKVGLDYVLTLPRRGSIRLSQGSDGLWRLGSYQPVVELLRPGGAATEGREKLQLMGSRRVGHVEVLESNRTRLRLASTWYFPSRADEWVSMAVRRIRWEYTFYWDGRWVTRVELNNAGGRQIGSIRISLPTGGVWAGGTGSQDQVVRGFKGPVGRWQFLSAAPGADREVLVRNYLVPAKVSPTLAAAGPYADGDADRDGFDESEGCYFFRANRAGHCRFKVIPPPAGLFSPVFRVAGQWDGPVSVSSEGLAIRNAVRLADGSVLFVLPGNVNRPTSIEVAGKAAAAAGP